MLTTFTNPMPPVPAARRRAQDKILRFNTGALTLTAATAGAAILTGTAAAAVVCGVAGGVFIVGTMVEGAVDDRCL